MNHLCSNAFGGWRFPWRWRGETYTMDRFISCLYGSPLCEPLSHFRSTWLAVVPHGSKTEECIGLISAQMKPHGFSELTQFSWQWMRGRRQDAPTSVRFWQAVWKKRWESIFPFNHFQVSRDAPVGHMVWWRLTSLCITIKALIAARICAACEAV